MKPIMLDIVGVVLGTCFCILCVAATASVIYKMWKDE